MKPAKVGVSSALTTWQQNNANSSHIPLLRRRGSIRCEEGEPADVVKHRSSHNNSSRRSQPEKSSVKSSILSSSTFCCASGQKDDVLLETAALRPAKKKALKSASQRGQQKLESETSPSQKKVKTRNTLLEEKSGNEVLESNDEKACRPKNRSTKREGLSHTTTTHVTESRYTDVMIRTLHKDTTHYTPNNLTSANLESNKLYTKVGNVRKTDNANATEREPNQANLPEEGHHHQVGELSSMMKSVDDLDCPCCTAPNDLNDDDCKATGCETQWRSAGKEMDNSPLKKEIELLQQSTPPTHFESGILQEVEQLKNELSRERNLRKDAEKKLMFLAHGRHPHHELRPDDRKEEELDSTAVGMHYQKLAASIETYIKKLEDTNVTLLNELKKLQDLSSPSREQEIQSLQAKVSQLEAEGLQQKADHDKCLDQVANKLVATLLAQKNAESECKFLQARLEQLQLESEQLMSNMKMQREEKSDTDKRKTSFSPPSEEAITIEKVETFRREDKSNRSPCIITKEKPEVKLKNFNEKQNNSSRIPSRNVSKIPPFGKNSQFGHGCDESQKRVFHPAISKKNIPKLERISPILSPGIETKACNSDPHRVNHTERKNFSNIKRKYNLQFGRGKGLYERNTSPIYEKLLRGKEVQPKIYTETNMECSQRDCIDTIWSAESVWNSGSCLNVLTLPVIDNSTAISELECEENTKLGDLKCLDDVCNGDSRSISIQEEGDSSVIAGSEPHRTRDEGYSTMSSDQQQDSTTDTTASEQEESLLTYVPSKFIGDDSVIEGSMTSSSDSGFGPLQQVAPQNRNLGTSNGDTSENLVELNKSTIVRNYPCKKSQSVIQKAPEDKHHLRCNVNTNCNESTYLQDVPVCDQNYSTIRLPTDQCFLLAEAKPITKASGFAEMDSGRPTSLVNTFLTHAYFQVSDPNSKQTSTSPDGQLLSKMPPVETAEKATLTEPEETLWREKALAHFIDESIWSLYSSESDTQLKFISAEIVKELTPLSVNSTEHELISGIRSVPEKTSICPEGQSSFPQFSLRKVAEELELLDNINEFRSTLPSFERAASDSVLYLKDVADQLEQGMKPGLKASKNLTKNIPLSRRFSDPDIDSVQFGSVELENTLTELPSHIVESMHKTFLSPASACRSHSWSVCSVSSSKSSCEASCDEMEDLDADFLPSSKDSQDPNLSSSDVEWENLDHHDFVEKWIEKEIPRQKILALKGDFEKKGCTAKEDAFFSYFKRHDARGDAPPEKTKDEDCKADSHSISFSANNECNISHPSNVRYPILFTCENINDDNDSNPDDIRLDLNLLDPDVKDFNNDFYRLCDIGSTLSMDRSVPLNPDPTDNRSNCSNKQTANCQFDVSKQADALSDVESCLQQDSKPEIFIKPLRPVTLSFFDVPDRINFHRFQKREFSSRHSSLTSPSTKDAYNLLINTETSGNNSEAGPSRKRNCKSLRSPANVKQFHRDIPRRSETKSIPTSKTNSQARSKSNSCRTKKSLPMVQSSGNCRIETGSRETYRHKRPNTFKNSTHKSRDSSPKERLCEAYEHQTETVKSNHVKEGCETAWVHVQTSQSDPKVLAKLLGEMASSSESGSEDEQRAPSLVQSNLHLYNICKEKRKRLKASRVDRVLALSPKHRLSVLNRNSLYYRFSEPEKEAISYFDFLEEIPTSSSELGSLETFSKGSSPLDSVPTTKEICTSKEENLPITWQKASVQYSVSSSTLNSQDMETFDHISFSDSCAESYTPDMGSTEDV